MYLLTLIKQHKALIKQLKEREADLTKVCILSCLLGNYFMLFVIFFSSSIFSKNYFRNTVRVSNILDPDKTQHFVWPYLVPTVCKGYQHTLLVGKECKNFIGAILNLVLLNIFTNYTSTQFYPVNLPDTGGQRLN